jgi:hypothetical protein
MSTNNEKYLVLGVKIEIFILFKRDYLKTKQ